MTAFLFLLLGIIGKKELFQGWCAHVLSGVLSNIRFKLLLYA